MIPMYYIHVPAMFSASPEHRLEDALDAFREIGESGELTGALCLTIVRWALKCRSHDARPANACFSLLNVGGHSTLLTER